MGRSALILSWIWSVDLPSMSPNDVKKTTPKMGFQAIWSMPTFWNTVCMDVPGSMRSRKP